MLTIQNTDAIRRIEEAIGYTFRDKRLLVQVLTRKTYLKIDPEAPDNEVLEFYGDTLMNYHVTNYFMSKYAHMLDDGLFFMRTVEQFTDMRSHYVCNRYLTDRVKALGLARHLRAQNRDSELRRDSEKAYADIFESLVGAIYLDSYQNDALIRAFILRQLGIEPKRLPEEIEAFDYNSLAYNISTEIAVPEVTPSFPSEEMEAIPEPPAPAEAVPVTEVLVDALEEVPVAEAAEVSVSEAETAPLSGAEPQIETAEEAAPALLPAEPAPTAETAVGAMQEALAEFCRQRDFELPVYSEAPKNAPNARPVATCAMKYRDAKGKLVKISLNDSGKTLAEATEKAAAKMLKKLEMQDSDIPRKAENPPKPAKAPVKSADAIPVPDAIEAAVRTAQDGEETATAVDVAEPVAEVVVEAEPKQLTIEVEETAAPAVTETEAVTADVAEAQPAAPSEAVEPSVSEGINGAVTEAEEAPAEAPPAAETEAVTNAVPQEAETASEQPAEAPKPTRAPRKRKTEATSTTDDGEKLARKPAGRKRAASKEVAPKSDETVPAAEDTSESTQAPAESPKPRARKPRTKKPVETAESAEPIVTAEPAATTEISAPEEIPAAAKVAAAEEVTATAEVTEAVPAETSAAIDAPVGETGPSTAE